MQIGPDMRGFLAHPAENLWRSRLCGGEGERFEPPVPLILIRIAAPDGIDEMDFR